MSQQRILVGDCREVLAMLAAGSVHCCVTSPPYFGLRSYLPDGHAAKRQEIGCEPSLDAYVAALVAVFREVWRVLRDDGTLWLNLGDSYANDGKWGGASGGKHVPSLRGRTGIGRQRHETGLKPKELMMAPARVALALQADGWTLRSEIIWAKRAPMPESVCDRPTCAHEKIFLFSKRPRYFYDAAAVAEESVADHDSRNGYNRPEQISRGGRGQAQGWTIQPTRNLRNVWTLGPSPYPDAHFATFAPEIPRRAILAGTSERGVCPACGAPHRRVVQRQRAPRGDAFGVKTAMNGHDHGQAGSPYMAVVQTETTGWAPTCQCDAGEPVPATVLDPFVGAGTTLLVADRLGRDGIGIELSPVYAEMARDRVSGDAPLFAAVEVLT